MIIWILIGLVVISIIFFNSLVRAKNRVEEAWSDIEVQLKRRYDLIPNLVNTVKGYAIHESTAFEKVTEARAKAMSAQTMTDHAGAEKMLGSAVSGIFGIAEAYPELKANTNFVELQRELADTENKIQASRRFYNGNVRDYNTSLQTFPGNVFAKMFSFTKKEFFDIDDNGPESKPVEVKF